MSCPSMSSAEGYTLAPGDPTLALWLPPFCSQSILGPPRLHTTVSVVPLLPSRSNSSALATQAPGFLSGLWPQRPSWSPPGAQEDPICRPGCSHPSSPSSPAGA